jgi:hypothetical protein
VFENCSYVDRECIEAESDPAYRYRNSVIEFDASGQIEVRRSSRHAPTPGARGSIGA